MNIVKTLAGLGLAALVIELLTRNRRNERQYEIQMEGLGFAVGDIVTESQLQAALEAYQQQTQDESEQQAEPSVPEPAPRYCGNHWCRRPLGPDEPVEKCLECHDECCEKCAYIFSLTGSYCSYTCYMDYGD